MDVGMIAQVARPSLEHGQETDLGAEIFVVAGEVAQGAGAFPQQQRVKVLLVGADDLAQLSRHGEGDQVVVRQATMPQTIRRVAVLPLPQSREDVNQVAGASLLQPVLLAELAKRNLFESFPSRPRLSAG